MTTISDIDIINDDLKLELEWLNGEEQIKKLNEFIGKDEYKDKTIDFMGVNVRLGDIEITWLVWTQLWTLSWVVEVDWLKTALRQKIQVTSDLEFWVWDIIQVYSRTTLLRRWILPSYTQILSLWWDILKINEIYTEDEGDRTSDIYPIFKCENHKWEEKHVAQIMIKATTASFAEMKNIELRKKLKRKLWVIKEHQEKEFITQYKGLSKQIITLAQKIQLSIQWWEAFLDECIENINNSMELLTKHELIEKFEEKDNFRFIIHTKDITCAWKNVWKYKIDIWLLEWWLNVRHSPKLSWNQHPHVSSGWTMCTWNITTDLTNVLKNLDLIASVNLIIAFLESYNSDNPHISLGRFMETI